jgi:hypothetical protein
MATNDEIEQRLTAVGKEARLAREVAGKAFVLAAGAESDVAEFSAKLNAQTNLIQALRDTQVEQGQAIESLRAEMHSEFASVRSELSTEIASVRTEMREGHVEMRQGFAIAAAGQAQITRLLEDIIENR